jgi:transcriptional regulator with XRE-family HTH domain
MITGETIRLLRTLKGVKQGTIAKSLGISQPAYSKIEKCQQIKETKARKILALLNCEEDQLMRIEQMKKAI